MKTYALGFDLGGTKLAAGLVDRDGKVLAERREPARIGEGPAAVLEQFARMADALRAELPARHRGRKLRVGIASAGPLDPDNGDLLDPTNYALTGGGTWGRYPLGRRVSARLKLPVTVENDAAAAALAEAWIGAGRRTQDLLVLTLGTGVGNGMIVGGELVRTGGRLHPEASHIPINADDRSAPCGCGNFGCIEAYLSGPNFARRAGFATGEAVVTAARAGDAKALAAFENYSDRLALALNAYAILYSPSVVVLTGGFERAADLFLPRATIRLRELLARLLESTPQLLPKITRSKLKNRAGIIGAARTAFIAER